jgi:hypothetical protein
MAAERDVAIAKQFRARPLDPDAYEAEHAALNQALREQRDAGDDGLVKIADTYQRRSAIPICLRSRPLLRIRETTRSETSCSQSLPPAGSRPVDQ